MLYVHVYLHTFLHRVAADAEKPDLDLEDYTPIKFNMLVLFGILTPLMCILAIAFTNW